MNMRKSRYPTKQPCFISSTLGTPQCVVLHYGCGWTFSTMLQFERAHHAKTVDKIVKVVLTVLATTALNAEKLKTKQNKSTSPRRAVPLSNSAVLSFLQFDLCWSSFGQRSTEKWQKVQSWLQLDLFWYATILSFTLYSRRQGCASQWKYPKVAVRMTAKRPF